MYPLVEPRQRPERFLLNRFSPLAESAALLGLGGFDAAGSAWYPDARRLLGAVPNDGKLTNMDAATDWVWSPELGRWALDFDGIDDYVPLNRPVFQVNADITFAVWINPRALSVVQNSVFLEGASGDSTRNYMYLTSSKVVVDQYPPGGGQFAVGASGLVGKWTHLAYVRTGITESIYINGQATSRTGGEVYSGTTPTFARLGARKPGGGEYVLNALLSDFVAAERAYSQDEIRTLADPSNVMLAVGGVPLILPPHRVSFPAAVAAGGFKPYWLRPSSQIIGGGIAA